MTRFPDVACALLASLAAFAPTVALARGGVAQDRPPAAPAAAENPLTRDLNGGPPSAFQARPEPTVAAPTPEAQPRSTPPVQAGPVEDAGARLTRDLNAAPPSAVVRSRPVAPEAAAPVTAPGEAREAAPAAAPASAPSERRTAPGTSDQPPSSTPAEASRTMSPAPVSVPSASPSPVSPSPASPSPVSLTPDEVAALPFRIDLPAGFLIAPRPAGPNARIYSVRRGEQGFLTIYAGPTSQFPIYDGQLAESGGRSSIIVTEQGRRWALEHLFQRATAPEEIHVWVASLDGEEREIAERIGHSIEAR